LKAKRVCLICKARLCECPGMWATKLENAQGICKLCALGPKCPVAAKVEIEEARGQEEKVGGGS
jgi:hypothetical protein